MGFILVVLSLCSVVNGLRLGTISPLGIHATLSSGRISVLFANLDFERSIKDLCTVLRPRRLGLFREYNLTIRKHPELIEEIAEAFSMLPDLQKDHRSRNTLFNFQLMDLLANKVNYRNIGLSYQSMQDVLKPTFSDLLRMESDEEMHRMGKATYLALDYLHFIIATFETTHEYEIIIEALVRIRFILTHLIDGYPDELEKNTRQLRYLQWNLESVLEKRPTLPLRKIRAYYCEMFKDFELEKGFCEDETENRLLFKDVEHGIWEIEEPARLKNLVHIQKFQKELTDKCNVQLIHMLNSPSSITSLVAKQVFNACGNGLMSEDIFAAMIIMIVAQGNLGPAYTLIEAILPNVHDIGMLQRKLSQFLHIGCDHKLTEMAIRSSLAERRGFLLPTDTQMYGVFEAQSIDDTRKMVMDRLIFHANKIFCENKPDGNLLKLISDYALMAVRLGICLRSWWTKICFEKRGVPTVKPVHLIMSVIMAPISEIVGHSFTIRDIYGALLDRNRCATSSTNSKL